MQQTINGFALAATDGNARAQDYSNVATHWAGDDVGSSSEKRATDGLNVTNASHDIHNVGSKEVANAPVTTYWYNSSGKATGTRGTYPYTWETTAGHGGKTPSGRTTGTTFMKKTSSFISATGAPRY